ncbi:MAG TPA: AI-2E family transporter [Candidatus Bathyarchaeia archaeon]|nr:AI-2E family transporter [Candidatus Bathyarchaeia archaeon]
MPQKVEISHRTIIFTVFFLLSLWALFQIKQIILAVFVSIILMSALNPAVDWLERFKIPRALAIIIVYIFIFGGIGVLLTGLIPPLVDQTTVLVSRLPSYLEEVGLPAIDERIVSSQISQLGSIPANLVRLTLTVFGNLLAFFILLVITFYLLLERKNLNRYLLIVFGKKDEGKAERLIDKVEERLGGWIRAEMTLMVFIGIITYLGLRLLGTEFALPLALLAGVLEIVPNIGPVLASIPAILAGLAISPLLALAVAALYFLIQQVENVWLVPKVMEKVAGVNPLVTILTLAIGFKLAGALGAVLSVPIVLVAQVVIAEFFSAKNLQ